MSQPHAYHVVVNALEARAGWKPVSRFASVVTHVINGHLPYERYHAAGIARRRDGMTEGMVGRVVSEWLNEDANPGRQILSSLTNAGNAVAAFNAYLQAAPLGVRSTLSITAKSAHSQRLSMQRRLCAVTSDPALCRVAVLAAFEHALDRVRLNAAKGERTPIRRLSHFALDMGTSSLASAELATVFEQEGSIPITQAARHLGCHQRTLERRLRQEGLTAEAVRQAARLLDATARLHSSASLTTVAVESGFSDLAHMSRAFRLSCGQPPSLLRAAALGIVVPEAVVAP
ncbi:MAG: helix-turn-helix domain-containing protein [Moraxellaceae bacterium]|nr:helix-turn-helix domain-containing protein [Moraxellaceae bacterium]